MKTNTTNLLNLTVTDSPRRSWLLRFWIVGCLLATSFCVFKGLEASSSTRPTTRQTTVTKEVRRQTRMDEVKVGDVVLARDEFGDTVAPKKVREIFRRTSDHLRLLTFESRDGTRQTIKTTDEHPFALADSLDFVPAGELTLGTEVPGPKGERQTLVVSIREQHPEGIPVFNFEVEGFHTYFVSSEDSPILVHNRCDDGFPRGRTRLDNGNLNEGWTHIEARHLNGTHPSGAGDLFAPGTTRKQIQKAADTLVDKGVRLSDPGRRIQTYERRMQVNGLSARFRAVVDSADGNRLITIFPALTD